MNGKVTFRWGKREEEQGGVAPPQQTVTVASMPEMDSAPHVEPIAAEEPVSDFKQAVMEIINVPEEPIAVEDPELFEVVPPQSSEQRITAKDDRELPEVTYIAPGTHITGSIAVDGDAEVYGHVDGHVDCGRNLRLNGQIDGGFTAENAELFDSQVTGDIEVRQALATRGNIVIKGNITADSLDFFGRLKGDVTAGNVLIIRKDSVVMGDVSSQSLYIEMGAVVQGKVNVVTEIMSGLEDME